MSIEQTWPLVAGILGIVIIIALAAFVVSILFCFSVYKSLTLIPENKLEFPAWFAFMILIPIAGYVFLWLTVFNVSRSFERAAEGNPEAQAKAKSLFGLGLAYAILSTLSVIPYIGFVTALATIIVWIIYWVKVVDFRRHYLDNLHH